MLNRIGHMCAAVCAWFLAGFCSHHEVMVEAFIKVGFEHALTLLMAFLLGGHSA